MIKEKGIKAGREFKIFKVWKGTTNSRNWCFFLYSQSEKQANGSYANGIKYTIWIDNEEIIDKIQPQSTIYLQKITLVKPNVDQNGAFGIEVRGIFSFNKDYQPTDNDGTQYPANQQPVENKNETTDFGFNDSKADDFDFGL